MKNRKRLLSIILSIVLSISLYAPNVHAANYTILETDVQTASSGCTMLGVYGTYYTDADEALARINEIRKEACDAGNVPDPRNSSRMLQPSDYKPIKWSTDLERIARLRAMEGGLCLRFIGSGHNRLNGKSWSSIRFNGVSTEAEDLAYNFDQNALDGIEQWYGEKSIWVNGGSGTTGHYTSMIDPDNTYIGLGDFYTSASAYPNTLCAEFSSTSSALSEDTLPAYTNVMQKIEVKDTYIKDYILDGSSSVYIGEQITLTPRVNLYNSSNDASLQLWIAEDVSYTSSNESVAAISADGVISGKAKGSTTITAKVNGTILATKTITVSCKHNKTLISTVPATCITTGSNTFSCSKCNETFNEVIPLAPHNYIYGDTDSSGVATGVCQNCPATITIAPPTSYSIYWRNNTSSSNYYYSYTPSSNPKGSTILAWLTSINGDENYRDFVMESSDEGILSSYKLGRDYAFDVLSTGIVKIKAYPVYNPSIAKTYTLRVGDEGDLAISDADITLSQTSYTYDGSERKPSVTLTYNDIKLTSGTDYTVTYKNNINAGTATVEITGAGIFGGTTNKTFTINKCDLSDATVTLSATSFEYDKTAKEPAVTVKLNSKLLTKGTDYTVTYNNNTNIGSGTVTIAGNGNYKGNVYKAFTIKHSSHAPEIIESISATCTETGLTEGSVCSLCGEILVEQETIPALGHNYIAAYNWADNCSSCTLVLTCQRCSDTLDKTMTITGPVTTAATCTMTGSKKYTATYTYNGKTYSNEKTITFPIDTSNHPSDKKQIDAYKAPTCTQSGLTQGFHCGACNKIFEAQQTISPLGHDYETSYNWSRDYSTCELVLTCQNDNSHIIKQDMDLEIFSKTLPTCTTAGYVHIKASTRYNNILYTKEIDKTIDPLGHDYSKKVINNQTLKSAATYDSPAIYYYTCSRCGDIGTTTFTYGDAVPRPTPDVTVSYHTHIQTLGDSQGVKTNGQMAGTSGMAKRLENIWITVDGNQNLGIQYTTHCQSYGWMPWSSNGEANGTAGEAKRLEAIKIQLTGADASKYDVYYRVHAQSYGWLGWAKNGEPSGTAGYAKRLEGIQIVIVKKGEAAPGLTYADVNASTSAYNNNPYIAKTTGTIVIPGNEASPNISYRTHVQSFGWQAWKYNGDMSGTSGMAKRLEGINIKISNCPYSGGIEYRTHIQSYGWENSWKQNGVMSGTSGQAKRLEAIQIRLTGEMEKHYDVYYRVHAQSYGWLNWAKNGEEAGTAGYAKRLEGIQIILVPKGQNAPGKTYLGITSVQNAAYIKR